MKPIRTITGRVSRTMRFGWAVELLGWVTGVLAALPLVPGVPMWAQIVGGALLAAIGRTIRHLRRLTRVPMAPTTRAEAATVMAEILAHEILETRPVDAVVAPRAAIPSDVGSNPAPAIPELPAGARGTGATPDAPISDGVSGIHRAIQDGAGGGAPAGDGFLVVVLPRAACSCDRVGGAHFPSCKLHPQRAVTPVDVPAAMRKRVEDGEET